MMSKAGTSREKDLLFSFGTDCNETFLILQEPVKKLSDPEEASPLVLLNLWSDVLEHAPSFLLADQMK